MDATDMLREAVIEAARETLDDPRINPEREVERLQNLIPSMFWGALQDLKDMAQDDDEDDGDSLVA